MRISLKITHELWRALDLEFVTPWDQEAQDRLLDSGLSWVRRTDDFVIHIYDVVDEKQFLLFVIEYGLDFKRCN